MSRSQRIDEMESMTLEEFFLLAERVGRAMATIREARSMLGPQSRLEQAAQNAAGEPPPELVQMRAAGVLRSTPQPNPNPVDPPEGLIARGKTGVEIIAERQRDEIRKRAEARGEVVELDPKHGLMDAEAQAVKARLRAQREEAERAALAKMTDVERAEFEGRA